MGVNFKQLIPLKNPVGSECARPEKTLRKD
jgi:hypothetical protein